MTRLPRELRLSDAVYPVIGTLFGREVGTAIGVIDGLQGLANEDGLKALGAAAASAGGVGLFHVAGVTPEAPDLATALGHQPPQRVITVTPQMLRAARDRLSTVPGTRLDAVAIGSPHLSLTEAQAMERLIAGRKLAVPLYANTGRHVLGVLDRDGRRAALEALGVIFVIDTCIVVTPILPELSGGVLMTNSGKFAHYAPGNTGYGVVFGAFAECIESAVSGTITRNEAMWGEPHEHAPHPVATGRGPVRHRRPDGACRADQLWGGVHPASAEIIDARHPNRGRCIAGSLLVLPGTIGSSSPPRCWWS